MSLVDATGAPVGGRKLSDQEIIQAFTVLQMKIDNVATQLLNSSFLHEYIIDKMNDLRLTPDAIAGEDEEFVNPLMLIQDELRDFATQRVADLEAEMEAASAKQATTSSLTLDE